MAGQGTHTALLGQCILCPQRPWIISNQSFFVVIQRHFRDPTTDAQRNSQNGKSENCMCWAQEDKELRICSYFAHWRLIYSFTWSLVLSRRHYFWKRCRAQVRKQSKLSWRSVAWRLTIHCCHSLWLNRHQNEIFPWEEAKEQSRHAF